MRILLVEPHKSPLSIGGEDIRHCLLELAAGLDPLPDEFNPVIGDAFDPLMALDHEGEGPHRMPSAVGAAAVGLAATPVCQ